MEDQQRFVIEVYHNGVCFKAPVQGRDRYLKEKAFLAELTGDTTYEASNRPVPDPPGDFYMLDDEQLGEYSAYRKLLEE